MRQFRIECIALNKEPAETTWDNIAGAAQALLRSFAPDVDIRQMPGGWSVNSDAWHHWAAVFDATAWVETGTLVFSALVALMLREDPDLLDFAVMLYYRDDDGDWIECG